MPQLQHTDGETCQPERLRVQIPPVAWIFSSSFFFEFPSQNEMEVHLYLRCDIINNELLAGLHEEKEA